MTSRDFCYWLQGYFEIRGEPVEAMEPRQVEMIKRHLALVFKHEIDPSQGSAEHQVELNAIHSPPVKPPPLSPVPFIPHGPQIRC